ncbi:MAG: amidohydrolase family protein [Chloroflexota bacterium]
MAALYLKDAPPRVFDVHAHYPWRREGAADFDVPTQAKIMAYTCSRLNIAKIALLGRPGEDTWQATLDTWQMFPDLVVPVAQIQLDEHTGDDVARLNDRGFRGLKITGPNRNYDDESYYSVYAVAEERKMPILFHTGIRGGPIDFLLFPPSSAEVAEEVSRQSEAMSRGGTKSTARMQPVYLDSIGMAFPDLRIIGAHLGYGLYDSAAAIARWRRNVSFDISGGQVVRRHIVDRDMIKTEVPISKLVWGSDCDVAHMSRELTAWMQDFAKLGLTADEQDAIFYRNAAAIYGFE